MDETYVEEPFVSLRMAMFHFKNHDLKMNTGVRTIRVQRERGRKRETLNYYFSPIPGI